ncbi:MAG: tetratricopeptide repeat protein [Proteobacteria bacterium]|nr:tetratricopeptide repeat protein [Pseudomonadota bacterium]
MAQSADLWAFLFTDIENSSVKWLERRPAMQQALARHDAILREAIADANGEVFKTAGDAFYAAFKRPVEAIASAIAAQHMLAKEDWSDVDELKVRMAVHVGTSEKREQDFFGPALNRCARLLVLAHGGQLLITSATAELLNAEREIDAPLRLLGSYPLDDPAQRVGIYQVVIADLPQEFPPLRGAGELATNLPQRLSPLIGREDELETIGKMIAGNRLVTLTGPGGVGKTRLALETGRDQLTKFAAASDSLHPGPALFDKGVWFVELAPLGDPALVPSAISTALGIELSEGKPPMEILANRLRTQNLLLILDNCEHLIDAVAHLSEKLLSVCPGVRILATSQEPINIDGEDVFYLQTLAVPPPDARDGAEVMKYAAAVLLVTRATAADSRFQITDENAIAIAAICRQLDGMALAIEMAAARVGALSIAEIAENLDQRFRLLNRGRRTALPRHQTLHAVLDWSHGLLPERERTTMRRLGIFAGGFTMEAAGTVAGMDALDAPDIFESVTALARKSLVNQTLTVATPRYHLLETTRSYAREKLADAGEMQGVARRHARFVGNLFERCLRDADTVSDATLREAYAPDIDNLRTALDWSFADGGDAATGIAIAGTIEPYYVMMALPSEARQRLELVSQHLSADTPPLRAARIWEGLGRLYGFSQPAKAFEALSRALPLRRALDDPQALGALLVYMGRIAQVLPGRAGESEALIAESEPLIAATGTARTKGHLYRAKGNSNAARGDYAASVEMMRLSHDAFSSAEAHTTAGTVRTSLAYVLWNAGDLDAAIGTCREVLTALRNERFPNAAAIGFALGNLAGMLTERGDAAEAQALFTEAAPSLRDPWQLWVNFDHVALCKAKRGHMDAAARALGFADAEYAKHRASRQPNEQRAHDAALHLVAKHITDEMLTLRMAEGAALSVEAAVALAAQDESHPSY